MFNLLRNLLNTYPSKEEILDHEIVHRSEVYRIVRAWKPTWKKVRHEDAQTRFQALSTLLQQLADLYQKPLTIHYIAEAPTCFYVPEEHLLVLNKSLSILSSLHEFAHHVYGTSEKQACRWSVWLFKKTFPKAYAKLEWQGHMLIRKPQPHDGTNQLDTAEQAVRIGTEVPEERLMEGGTPQPVNPETSPSGNLE
jgi:hypothetical protein